jgi:hypothetical protein
MIKAQRVSANTSYYLFKCDRRYVIFVNEFVVLGKNLPAYELMKKIFFLNHLSPSFLALKLL